MAEKRIIESVPEVKEGIAESLNLTAREVESMTAPEAESDLNAKSEESVQDKKSSIRAEAEVLVQAYNDAFQTAKFEEAHRLSIQIEEKINEYTHIARDECFAEILASKNPMLEAVKRLRFIGIRTKTRKEGDEKIPVTYIEDTEKTISLNALDRQSMEKEKRHIGANENWYPMIEKLNFLLTAQACIDLNIDPRRVNDSFAMSKIARELDMGATPTSNTRLLALIQSVVTAMLGDGYKVALQDVRFLKKIYTKKSRKALTIVCANHKLLVSYIAEICNRIVTSNPYDAEFRVVKQ